MSIAIVTGSSGLIGSEAAKFFHEKGFDIVGIDNNMREYFFGLDGSVEWNTESLKSSLGNFTHYPTDIRNESAIRRIFRRYDKDIAVVIHAAAQPSHDWAAKEPLTDFGVNAVGTLVLLEAARESSPDAPFIFTSTNKVYGDSPNSLPLVEKETRWEISEDHGYYERGINESMSIDSSKHSVFGASKVAADVMAQEYGRYFGLKTGIFRGGCLTGPAHSGAMLHGFLAYLVKCVVYEKPYTIFGYKGKQVRDNIHSSDLVRAFWHFYEDPKTGAVYNMGGSRHSNCSVLEAISIAEAKAVKRLDFEVSDQAREGDHIWWISDVSRFQSDYPTWNFEYDLETTIGEIVDATEARMAEEARGRLAAARFATVQTTRTAASRAR
jgi:CDP-paratose 2-epimerase